MMARPLGSGSRRGAPSRRASRPIRVTILRAKGSRNWAQEPTTKAGGGLLAGAPSPLRGEGDGRHQTKQDREPQSSRSKGAVSGCYSHIERRAALRHGGREGQSAKRDGMG
jgi:hypothetical protein